MRDGNSDYPAHPVRRLQGPRPSYEGWKHIRSLAAHVLTLRPRPSYEGWKLEDHMRPDIPRLARDLPVRDGND